MPPILEILQAMAAVYADLWWIFTPVILLTLFQVMWMNYVQNKHLFTLPWSLLEITVPKEIERSPKIVEQLLANLWGVYGGAIDTIYDIYLKGIVEYYFSLEIVGIDGKTHFFVRTPSGLRDFVEAQIYAQYPEAEIKEVEDYTLKVPKEIPNKDWDLWGTEMRLSKPDAYPILTYQQLEDKPTGTLVDPVSSIMEGFSKLMPGEQIWIQILIKPLEDHWKIDALKLVQKLIGKKMPRAAITTTEILGGEISDIGRYIAQAPFRVPEARRPAEEKLVEVPESLMLYLSPGEREIVEAIEHNVAKPGFETKIRWIYVGERKVFFKGRGVPIVLGPFTQFKTLHLNSFEVNPITKTSAYYFFTEWRKNWRKRDLLSKYRLRSFREKGFVLNLEELATIFHFPTISVKAPLIPRITARKAEPPKELPIE